MPRSPLLLITLILVTFFLTHFVNAESLSISLQVGSTQLTFSGYTSPNALVVIKEDGSVIGTTTSSGSGSFSHTLTVAVPNLHTYVLYATDTANHNTENVSYNLSILGNTTTTIDNIVLPPTLILLGNEISGTSYPGSTITITSSLGDSSTLTTNVAGNWSYDLTLLTPGTHTLTVTATVGSYISINSDSVTYTTITSAPNPSSTTSSPTPSTHSPSPSATSLPQITPSPTPPSFIHIYDTNNDGRLGLNELFSIITNWITKHLPCDLNHDRVCNLIDLSILLYYFER